MLRSCAKLLKSTNLQLSTLNLSSSSVLNEKWDLVTAVCVERKPVVTPELNDLEKKYQSILSQIEFERSLKSDYEVRHEKEQKQIELLKKGDDVDAPLKQTAQDLVDAATEELAKFTFASRITEDDKTNNIKSLRRQLDKHLVLVTKHQIGGKDFFLLPQCYREEGETLRQAAERTLKQHCGEDLKALIYSNAPSGFYKYKYPKSVENDAIGAKVFIYFARYQKGNVGSKADYKWLTREEMANTFIIPEYQKSVAQMLIDE